METAPLVTVLLAVHDGERYLQTAVASILGQTVADLELVVVDDASTDRSPALLERVADRRLRVLRNEEQLGLAGSLNRGLAEARGTYVARLDADDIALPRRLELQLGRIRSAPRAAVVGSAVLDLDTGGRAGAVHAMPVGATEVRWAALFSSPFFHPTVLVERDLLERQGLRYDESYVESEDYELWSRLLEIADGDNVVEPLVLYRVHAEQASQRRHELQREYQLRVARRAISGIAPGLTESEVELVWRIGAAEHVDPDHAERGVGAYFELLAAFERRHGRAARERAARDLMRVARSVPGPSGARIAARALRLDPLLPSHVVDRRRERRRVGSAVRRSAEEWVRRLAPTGSPIRVAAVFPEPTPYRTPLLDRIAALEEIDLEVFYASRTLVGRSWKIVPEHRATYLRGLRLPGVDRIVRHDYPVTPGVPGALSRARPDVVVVSGWSTFAAQAAIAWCRVKDVPYVLVVESHDEGPRSGWRRAVKGAVVPEVVGRSSGVLVTGTLARDSMIARGAAPERVRVFANTVDVDDFGARADRLRASRDALRRDLAIGADDVAVLCVARLGPEKRLDDLAQAVAGADRPGLVLVLAGEGPERSSLERLSRQLDVRLVLLGDVEWERIVELYVAADVFALLSERETWGVVVNEAAACGLPLVLSDRVGAAHDLLRDGENGALVPAADVDAAALALRELADDPERRRAQGARSRELARDWGYGPSVEGFLEAVREAANDRG
ncbi:MAG TPA: glycosyltransferase [Gaiellaceae bacterium]|nr:glycosyltransferase [Gaiellaceae bacterium]